MRTIKGRHKKQVKLIKLAAISNSKWDFIKIGVCIEIN